MKRWVPNALSLSRVPLGFALLLVYRVDPRALTIAIVLFLIANATDLFDGALARRFGVANHQGYLVDGFADRTFSVACVLGATMSNGLPMWAALLAVAREMLLYTCRLIDPKGWHPPSRTARLHSVAVFGTTRLWFFALLLVGFAEPADRSLFVLACNVLNGAYSVVVGISVLILVDTLLRTVAKCFD